MSTQAEQALRHLRELSAKWSGAWDDRMADWADTFERLDRELITAGSVPAPR